MQTTLHITVWLPDTSLSQDLLQRRLYPFWLRTCFCVTHMQDRISDSTPYLSVWTAHPSDHPSISLLESHDPITLSLVDHRIDPNIPAVTLLHEMFQTWTVTADWKACRFTLYHWQSYKGLSSYFSETWLKYLQSPACRYTPYRQVTRACSKCFILSHLMPVTHRLSLNRKMLP